jgi:hypothetical protein
MTKIVTAVVFILFLAACSPGQRAANEGGNYVWIGCHVIHSNPAPCYPGSDKCKVYAFDVAGDRYVGERIYFKQLRKGQDRYGKFGKIATARPCREGE